MADSSDVVAGTNGTATQYNNLRKDVVLAKAILGTETYAASMTIDWSDMTKGKIRTITLTGNVTSLAFSNATVGQVLFLRVIQGGAGSYTVAFPTAKWPGGAAPTLTTTVGAIDAFMFICTAASTYEAYHAGFGLS